VTGARLGGIAKAIVIALLAIPIAVVGGEFLLREFLVRPVIVDAFLSRSDLRDDLALRSNAPHLAVVHIGNGLRASCADNCFNWSDYQNIDVILALSPTPDIRGTVRVLSTCDTDCVALPNQQGFVRPATDAELSMDESVSSEACTELTGFIYAAQHCRWQETQAGRVVRVQHTLFWEHPAMTLPWPVRFVPIGSVRIDIVEGRISGQQDFVERLDRRSP
jgi:hypothetical protein